MPPDAALRAGERLGLIAHGGTAGLVVELTLTIGIVALAVAVWVHSRRRPEDDEGPD